MEPFASVVASDIVRLFLLLFACSPDVDLPMRLREECIIIGQENVTKDVPASIPIGFFDDQEVDAGCSSLNEKLWPHDGLCYGIMTRGPCKENQLFFLDPENSEHGFCDCRSDFRNGSLILYSEEADECYLQNTQVDDTFRGKLTDLIPFHWSRARAKRVSGLCCPMKQTVTRLWFLSAKHFPEVVWLMGSTSAGVLTKKTRITFTVTVQ